MKYCDKCKVSIVGKHDKCPLCQGLVAGEVTDNVFPYVPTIYKKYSLFFRLLIFISLVISSICILIDVMVPTGVNFSIFVVAGFACLILILRVAINRHRNVPKTILWQVVVISILSLLWDYFTGRHGWSITYVIPIICLVGSIDMAIIVNVMKIYITEYIFYFLLTIILGLIPVIFCLTGIVNVYYPSVICFFLNLIALMTMFVFAGDLVIEELKRRLHF